MKAEYSDAPMENGEGTSTESRCLHYILGGQVTDFFDSVWQVSCAVFTMPPLLSAVAAAAADVPGSDPALPQPAWNLEQVQENPIRELIKHGFTVLTDLMEQTHRRQSPHGAVVLENNAPLLFRNRQMVPMEERHQYSYADANSSNNSSSSSNGSSTTTTNLWAAFLDGCSVVLNHADLQSPWLAALCTDLQLSVPHAYVNAYITPPASQAVAAHADDRDVFIVQVYGRKRWTVYETVPITYPFPHEQVGKDDLPVPEAVLKGPVLLQRTLAPGDVLYMPRGHVHQAVSCDDCCSFHVTVALATHDWSLTGLLGAASQSVFSQQVDFRQAVNRQWGRHSGPVDPDTVAALQSQLDRAIQLLREEVTVDSIDAALRNKYQRHNQRAAFLRQPLLQGYTSCSAVTTTAVVGREAASTVTLSTRLRAATDDEKRNLIRQQAMILASNASTDAAADDDDKTRQRGLHVRNEIYEGIFEMIQHLKQQPTVHCTVRQLRSLVLANFESAALICDLTLLSMARRCVELGALAIQK